MAWNTGNLIFWFVVMVIVMMNDMWFNVFDMLENCVRVMMMFYVIRYMNDNVFMM